MKCVDRKYEILFFVRSSNSLTRQARLPISDSRVGHPPPIETKKGANGTLFFLTGIFIGDCRPRSSLFVAGAIPETLVKAIDAAGCVENLLLPGVERMAL